MGRTRLALNGRTPVGWTGAERRLWKAYPTGAMVDLTTRRDRAVRAEALARLLRGGRASRPGHTPAVRLRGATVTGPLDLRNGTVSCELWLDDCVLEEPVGLVNARMGQVRISGCTVPSLDGGGLHCDGYLSLSRSTFNGPVRLPGAQLLGGLRMNGTRITKPGADGWAVLASESLVEAGMSVDDAEIDGSVRLAGARLNGGLSMRGTTLRNTPGKPALNGEQMVVTDTMDLGRGFTARGQIHLRGTQVNGLLTFSESVVRCTEKEPWFGHPVALQLIHLRVSELRLRAAELTGAIALSYAQVGTLYDEPESWPDQLWLNGTVYEHLRGARPAERLGWLARDDRYYPQPYEQLADWYRRNGHDDLARRTQLAKLRARRARRPRLRRVPGYLLDWTVGYGYRPWRAAICFGVLLTMGTVVFTMVPPRQLAYPQQQPDFNPFAYTLDLLLPVSTFGQREAWQALGWTRWLSYTLIVSGWILATALIAGATRVLRPDR